MAVRGRPRMPKPFQSFQETSFPSFVEELAVELFTADAAPFPVQAQAWPCILSGFDVVAVAPTGSGKTLAFLLPALVHITAQPHLTEREGPIALILSPTRELALQTHSLAVQFCARTSGEDTLRAGVVHGGVAADSQVPVPGAPDFGRWQEILVATPGRVLDLIMKRRWMSAKRISYVVLDEADQLLSSGGWLDQVRMLLKRLRPDRQLLCFSATWPAEAEVAATDLCGDELVKIRVNPAVPSIPQDVVLFPGSFDGGHETKVAALLRWMQEDFGAEESLLLLFNNANAARSFADSGEIDAALGNEPGSASVCAKFLDYQRQEDQHSSYVDFVHGKVRVLVSTFSLAGRGLDFCETATPAQSRARPLSLVVLLFDFPRTIGDYANCIGRTSRPGQSTGRAVAFLPEGRFWIAGELIALMEHSGREVPKSLRELHDEDQKFLAEIRTGMLELLDEDKGSLAPGLTCGGDFDPERRVWMLPETLPSYRRKLLHMMADELNVPHVSSGQGESRRLHLASDRSALPDKFFLPGEIVMVARQPGRPGERAKVIDSHINKRKRTIQVRFLKHTNYREDASGFVEVPVDMVYLEGQEPPSSSWGQEWMPQARHNGHFQHGRARSGYGGYGGYGPQR
eukprot:TRINITY_DN9265_c0_g1_i1.p1 TRINITY_DN9265_c0_g1~~TRINITY_DN9265_c0_g1_i1.p1  ORF type:complete len:723 (-),score=147.39 TRINITY_DN9265_c0_g1_i1:7-1893(-)